MQDTVKYLTDKIEKCKCKEDVIPTYIQVILRNEMYLPSKINPVIIEKFGYAELTFIKEKAHLKVNESR